jgi:hypothetical protein
VKVATHLGAPTIQVNVLSGEKSFIIDTGSNVSLVQPGVSNNKMKAASVTPFRETGDDLEITGIQEIEFRCNSYNYCHQFYVCSLPTDADGIIGMDFLSMVKAKLDLERYELLILKYVKINHGPSNQEAREVWPTVWLSRYFLIQTVMKTGRYLS